MAAVADEIEPVAKGLIGMEPHDDHLVALASIAISLRRIGDALAAPDPPGTLNIRDLLSGIEMNGRRN